MLRHPQKRPGRRPAARGRYPLECSARICPLGIARYARDPLPHRIFAQGRALIADDFSVTKTESQATWRGDKLSLAGGHVWVMADAAEDRPDPIHELTLDTSYQFNSSWAGSFNSHYDMEGGTATKATLGLEYRNECIVVDLSLSRNFTSSGIVTPTTDIGFGVELTGFGGGSGAGGRSRQCSG